MTENIIYAGIISLTFGVPPRHLRHAAGLCPGRRGRTVGHCRRTDSPYDCGDRGSADLVGSGTCWVLRIMNVRVVLQNAGHQLQTQGLVSTLGSLFRRAQIRWNEWRFRIRSEAYIELSAFGIHDDECKHYSATSYGDFAKIMRTLDIDPRQHVFLDYGAGMGRAMVLAATYPFKRVLGVDIVPALTAIAAENFARGRHRLKCQDIDIATADATLYEIPGDVTLFYLANPFNGSVLAAVMRNIQEFAAAAPRPLLLVCNVPDRSAFEDQIRKHPWLELKREVPLQKARRCLVFAAPGGRGAAGR